jgi:UDP-N-acetyl-2-amino-2-deoxyglucuronate dehydrogenase
MAVRFALIGAAGFVAPRHLGAIQAVGGDLVAATDPSDSVGVLDEHFPETRFFREIERFDRYLETLRRAGPGSQVDWVSICSPNFLHDAHVRLALRVRANALCEKPLVLSPWNLDALSALEEETGQRVATVLQLRLLPAVRALRERLSGGTARHEVELRYVTRRGPWYQVSWKGDESRSGGLAMNIGVHFFDLLIHLFGDSRGIELERRDAWRVSGSIELERADVRFFLSIAADDLGSEVRARGGFAERTLTIDGEALDLSPGFTDLHTEVYRETLAGRGFRIDDARPSIELVHRLRAMTPLNGG